MPRHILPTIPPTPEVRRGFRNKDYVQPVAMRLGTGYVDALDELCAVNNRSRREIVEILIEHATRKFLADPNSRLVGV